LHTYSCSLHGVGIHIKGSRNVISALESRLGQLPSAGISGDTLHFEFRLAASPSDHRIDRPQGSCRTFYNALHGQALFFPAKDVIYLDYGGRARVLCEPEKGRCYISLLEPELEQLWLVTHPLFTIPLIEMLKRRGKFNLHAAAVAVDGSGILLPGTTGAGKSTLSIGLLRANFDFLGDDMVFVQQAKGLRILAFVEKIDITDTTASFFEELSGVMDRDKRAGWPKHEIDSGDFFSSRLVASATPKAIVFPRVGNVVESTLLPIGVEEAFLELAPSVLLTETRSTQAHLDVLAQLANTTPSYRLSTGLDFDRSANMLRELVT